MTENLQPRSVRTLGDLLERKAEKLGEKTFFHFDNEEYSYEDLNQRAKVLAANLRSIGVGPGDVVCIFMYNRPEYLYTLFGLAKIGAIAAPVDTRFTGESLVHIFTETNSPVIILDQDTRAAYEDVREDASTFRAEFLVSPDRDNTSYRNFEQLLEGDQELMRETTVAGSDTCSVIYVSRYQRKLPQGVMLPHYSYINTGWECSKNLFELGTEDCIFTTLPFYSSYPIQIGVTGAMLAEAEFAFEKQFRRETFWDWVRTYDATMFLYLGRMLSVLHNQEQDPQDSENPARFAFGYGFGVETDETMITQFEDRFGITIVEGYGITLTATIATSNRPDARKLGSVGTPVSYAKVEIVDENDWFLPPGETGEIVIWTEQPNTMLQNFYNDPELTADVCRNQWIHTNDIGYKDEDGFVYFVARKTDTIELGRVAGRISSLEIESVIESHPDISESVVLGVTDKSGEESIKAVVVSAASDLGPIDVSTYCEQRLAYHKIPRYVEFRDELPRAPSGKVRKEELQNVGPTKGVWDREIGYSLKR